MTSWRVIEGDCRDVMASMDEASVDAIICDPPYGIGFMGKAWDGKAIADAAAKDRAARKSLGPASASRPGRAQSRSKSAYGNEAIIAGPVRGGSDFQAWCEAWATEALRVLKPGGHLLAFGGTRTYHRLTCAIEDAGFKVRDCLAWMYGAGFPKSLNAGKAIDTLPWRRPGDFRLREAAAWAGHGTALKPAHEPIVLARKPLAGTVAATVLGHGTGAINVDGCRVAGPIGDNWGGSIGSGAGRESANVDGSAFGRGLGGVVAAPHVAGRWPANVILGCACEDDAQHDPDCAVRLLDEQTGELTSGSGPLRRNADKFQTTFGEFAGGDEPADVLYGDSGGASRFFYVAKVSAAERNMGLGGKRNSHATVKPVALMQWLVRLVTPPDGTVLDPFCGSGSTGIAALREGFSFVGIEREPEYVVIARARIIGDCPLHNQAAEA